MKITITELKKIVDEEVKNILSEDIAASAKIQSSVNKIWGSFIKTWVKFQVDMERSFNDQIK